MLKLRALVYEINNGVEIYFTGRSSHAYANTAFILCDDYSELTAKLFLLTDNPAWSDRRPAGTFKSYPEVMDDVESIVATKLAGRLVDIQRLCTEMKERRKRRNEFFHSTSLLGLTMGFNECVEAFCDLMEIGSILFPRDWTKVVREIANLETYHILLLLDRSSPYHPELRAKVEVVLQGAAINISKPDKTGTQVAIYPEDFHLRLAVRNGGENLKLRLRNLLPP